MEINGRLKYLGLSLGCIVSTAEGEIDLWQKIEVLLENLNEKTVRQENEKSNYALFADENALSELDYKKEKLALLCDAHGNASNVYAYLDTSLTWLTGRLVKIRITETEFRIAADTSEKVYGVHFTNDNSCAVTSDIADRICKIGKPDCCIFLSYSGEGFSCQKFSGSIARIVLERHAKGTMKASRIGNCEILKPDEKSSL